MKLFRRISGPRLGTKLMLLGLMLLIVPWFSYRQLVEMERLLILGQSNAQLLTARGISTLFNGREDLFNDLPVTIENYESLYAHPLQGNVRLDGKVEDWGEGLADAILSFGSESGTSDADFSLLLGERGGQLYVHMNIIDAHHVYRDPEYLRLDNADHVRLSFIRADGEDGRINLTLPEPGVVTAYQMDADWRFAATGTPDNNIQGFVEETDDGYLLEFRMPLDYLGSSRGFGLDFVDVDDAENREIRATTQTLPTAGKESFNLVVLRSPELLNIIQGLGYSGARILVIDAQNRVRAETGTILDNSTRAGDAASAPEAGIKVLRSWFESVRPLIHRLTTGEEWQPSRSQPEDAEATADAAIASSLSGDPIALRRSISKTNEVIMAAHPIVS
ncbi:MAG: hypothetical protein O7E57_00700, partial [Gammaproteobacteria bacterium]|nr:hypothetical protein [Gammaproteobacteria bacterium]